MEVKNLIKIYKIVKKENVELEASLKEYSSFKIGGVAKIMIYPTTIKNTVKLLKFLNKIKINYTILGNATNVLISGDLEVVISVKKLKNYKIKNNLVYAESGLSLFKFNEILKDNELSGLERTYGIPGSVGGGIVQNCGAYGYNISDNLQKVIYFDGKKIKKVNKEKLFFGYRTSEFKNHKNYVVLGGIFKFTKSTKNQIETRLNEIITTRKEKQPYEYPSAGSVFKRIDGVIISKMIDELNLKGTKVGGAMVSEKHAGFIVNYNNATYEDVISLINFVKKTVKTEKNIDLELEIVLL